MGPIEFSPPVGRSSRKRTAATPSAARAAVASMAVTMAGACVARTSQPWSVPGGSGTSSVYRASPVVCSAPAACGQRLADDAHAARLRRLRLARRGDPRCVCRLEARVGSERVALAPLGRVAWARPRTTDAAVRSAAAMSGGGGAPAGAASARSIAVATKNLNRNEAARAVRYSGCPPAPTAAPEARPSARRTRCPPSPHPTTTPRAPPPPSARATTVGASPPNASVASATFHAPSVGVRRTWMPAVTIEMSSSRRRACLNAGVRPGSNGEQRRPRGGGLLEGTDEGVSMSVRHDGDDDLVGLRGRRLR